MNALDVSVILPTYNAETCVTRAIHSAASQTGVGAIEILACDDASTDGTLRVLHGLAGDIPGLRIFENATNAGPSVRRNQAIAAARGRWIAILDADDAFVPGRLARLIGQAEAGGFEVIADLPLLYDLTAGCPEPHQPSQPTGEIEPVTLSDLVDPGHPKGIELGQLKPVFHGRLAREKLWRYPEGVRHGEDFELYFDLLHSGVRFGLLREALYLFSTRVGAVSRKRSRGSVTRLDFPGLARQAEARAAALETGPDPRPDLAAMMRQRAEQARRSNRVHGWLALRHGELGPLVTWLRHDPGNRAELLGILRAKLGGHRGLPD